MKKPLTLGLCAACIGMMLFSSCNDVGSNINPTVLNTADLGISAYGKYVLKTKYPVIYDEDSNSTHPLLQDPFIQLNKAQETYLLSFYNNTFYIKEPQKPYYQIYSVDGNTMQYEVDTLIPRPDPNPALLGLEKTFGYYFQKGGNINTREILDAFFTTKDEHILIGLHGIYSLSRKGGSEICIYEDEILGPNYACDGNTIYYLNSSFELKCLNLTSRKASILLDNVRDFYLFDNGVWFTQTDREGIFQYEWDRQEKIKVSNNSFSFICQVGDTVYYVNRKDGYVYSLNKEFSDKLVYEAHVQRLGGWGNNKLVFQTADHIYYMDLDTKNKQILM